jgi:hypothetical protein
MRRGHGEGAGRSGPAQSPAALLTAAEAREAAALLSVEGLVLRAQDYLSRYEKDLRSEGGGVPVELGAVLGVLRSGKPGFFWYVPRAVQARLDVGRGASPALQLWAGLRTVNEAAIRLEQVQGAAGLPRDAAPADYWAAVLRLEALGPRAFIALCHAAGGAAGLAQHVLATDPGVVAGLAEGTTVYRVLAVSSWVQAALELCASREVELTAGPGVIIGSRDERVRKIAKRATMGGWVGTSLLMLAKARGIIPS